MKKYLLVTLLFLSIGLVGCGKKDNGKIIRFFYSYGSYNSGEHVYDIEVKDEKATIKANGYNGIELNLDKEISTSYLEKINNIVKKYDIVSWDKFKKTNYDVLDGDGFSLIIKFENGKEIAATGYMKYPKDYKKASKEIQKILESIK